MASSRSVAMTFALGKAAPKVAAGSPGPVAMSRIWKDREIPVEFLRSQAANSLQCCSAPFLPLSASAPWPSPEFPAKWVCCPRITAEKMPSAPREPQRHWGFGRYRR
eukprot:scaffold1424_cov237-Pinguiococcus_pyrenoidosus.AAC.17